MDTIEIKDSERGNEMERMLRWIVAGFVAFSILFSWIIATPGFMYFLVGMCFLAAIQALFLFRKFKAPWNVTHFVAPLMIGILLMFYATHI